MESIRALLSSIRASCGLVSKEIEDDLSEAIRTVRHNKDCEVLAILAETLDIFINNVEQGFDSVMLGRLDQMLDDVNAKLKELNHAQAIVDSIQGWDDDRANMLETVASRDSFHESRLNAFFCKNTTAHNDAIAALNELVCAGLLLRIKRRDGDTIYIATDAGERKWHELMRAPVRAE
jgi:hypothetical protein